LAALEKLIKETGATRVVWNRRYEPAVVRRDEKIKRTLTKRGIRVEDFNGALLYEPGTVKTGAGKPYQVFTPFWRACTSMPPPPKPLAAPKKIPAPEKFPSSETIESLSLLPKIKWDAVFSDEWEPGEAGAQRALKKFLRDADAYPTARDIPSKIGTSRLSPHLHFGEISPRQIWHAAERHSVFIKELGWREFAHHLLFHFPHTAERPLRPAFEKFPWQKNSALLKAWQRGKTGYPIVDAGMRELWKIGWMHNRVRMIVASFLVKDLRISWLEGARWFWDTLVDADLANNTLGWQWSAGCGADAAPYFRIFSPTSQAEKFDPNGAYVKKWVKAPAPPIVDHAQARIEALAAFKTIPSSSTSRTAAGKSKAPR
jgi:deoxyribodipyrimidine photo-lyase